MFLNIAKICKLQPLRGENRVRKSHEFFVTRLGLNVLKYTALDRELIIDKPQHRNLRIEIGTQSTKSYITSIINVYFNCPSHFDVLF